MSPTGLHRTVGELETIKVMPSFFIYYLPILCIFKHAHLIEINLATEKLSLSYPTPSLKKCSHKILCLPALRDRLGKKTLNLKINIGIVIEKYEPINCCLFLVRIIIQQRRGRASNTKLSAFLLQSIKQNKLKL